MAPCPRSLMQANERVAVHHMRHDVVREPQAMPTMSADDRDRPMRAILSAQPPHTYCVIVVNEQSALNKTRHTL